MKESPRPRRTVSTGARNGIAILLSCASLLSGGCSGGGGSGGGALGGAFGLQSASINNGQVWQINRPMQFVFSKAVDFQSVNPNTIHIADLGGQPAVGTFSGDPSDPRVVNFQPRCPTLGDFSDAGLKPGGVQYRIRISDQSSGAGSVQSTQGEGVLVSQTISFFTPTSPFPNELFLDPVPGPPSPIAGAQAPDGLVTGTRLEFIDGSGSLPFAIDSTGVGVLPPPVGAAPGAAPRLVPLNLYSQVASRFRVIVVLNQPVLPTPENISPLRMQFQFLNAGEWLPFPSRVELAANCTAVGSAIQLTPIGVLPQNRELRIWLGPEFEDLVGDRNILALTDFAAMKSDLFTEDGTPGGVPTEFADELLEEFLLGASFIQSFEDDEAVFDKPRAVWGGDRLAPGFAFEGTGGPAGNFDWYIQANTTVIFDTTSTLILGGPGGTPTASQLAVNGLVNLRDLVIPATSRLVIQGPNPATFLCSGKVQINGVLSINGNKAQPVYTVNLPSQPEPGALGNGGGGSGGIGSFLTNQVTPRGGTGRGAFNVAGLGGQGGESGWHPDGSNNGVLRRAAGGGGGTFGANVKRTGTSGSDCFSQTLIGLDAESGFPGAVTANSTTRLGEVMPWGGREGPRPFTDVMGELDDFWGTLLVGFGTSAQSLITGELPTPWAGAGGGAGGDATRAETYPPAELIPTDQDKGAGGGGGAGSLTIFALGNVAFGPAGRIEANGGHGSGGENTSGTNRVAGGSGGGSGGHIVIQTASMLDLGSVAPGTLAIIARGGQGGAGADDIGGANTFETAPHLDSLHIGVTGPGDLSDNPWIDLVPADCLISGSGTALGLPVVRAAGGDGGPGIVQIHVGSLPGDVVPPGGINQGNLRTAIIPAPVGYDGVSGTWVNKLIPLFGRFSQAQSKWIPLGGVVYAPDDETVLDPITFLFGGTDDDGLIVASGGVVDDLPPLLAPANELQQTGLPQVDEQDGRRLLLDATELTGDDAIYRLNPSLLRRFRVRIGAQAFEVESAQILNPGAGEEILAINVPSTGPPLPTSGLVTVIPRFFSVQTSGITDSLLASSSIKIDFQATTADEFGMPEVDNAFPGSMAPLTEGWAPDIETLNFPANTDFRFYRFRVVFDLGADGSPLSVNTARPALEFLRVPFRF